MSHRVVVSTVLMCAVASLLAIPSHGFASDYGAYDGSVLLYPVAGLYVLGPVAPVLGAAAGLAPRLLGERRASIRAAGVVTLVALVAIAGGSASGTRARAALYPTSPVCPAGAAATPQEVESAAELERVLVAMDHPVRFERSTAEASADHCQIAFAQPHLAEDVTPHYLRMLESQGWRVSQPQQQSWTFLVARRGDLRVEIFVDDPDFRGLLVLRVERE